MTARPTVRPRGTRRSCHPITGRVTVTERQPAATGQIIRRLAARDHMWVGRVPADPTLAADPPDSRDQFDRLV